MLMRSQTRWGQNWQHAAHGASTDVACTSNAESHLDAPKWSSAVSTGHLQFAQLTSPAWLFDLLHVELHHMPGSGPCTTVSKCACTSTHCNTLQRMSINDTYLCLQRIHNKQLDRKLGGLKPYHRVAMKHFRDHGVFLPFGALDAHHNTPNCSLLDPVYGWMLGEVQDPLDSWNIEVGSWWAAGGQRVGSWWAAGSGWAAGRQQGYGSLASEQHRSRLYTACIENTRTACLLDDACRRAACLPHHVTGVTPASELYCVVGIQTLPVSCCAHQLHAPCSHGYRLWPIDPEALLALRRRCWLRGASSSCHPMMCMGRCTTMCAASWQPLRSAWARASCR